MRYTFEMANVALNLPYEVQGDETPRSSERILLVVDEEDVRAVSVEVLRRQGYNIVGVGDGKAVVKHLQASALA
jgi:response regulator RpfG family c-di-GMP phosphodiesterase